MNLKGAVLSALPFPLTLRLSQRRPWLTRHIATQITLMFHMLYHSREKETWMNTYWFGVPVLKVPFDLWIYQEIINEIRPDVMIETGSRNGGSAYYFACLFDLIHHGRVITIDVEDRPGKPRHDRITYLIGSSTSDEILQIVRSSIRQGERVMVTLDSDHRAPHVLDELRVYGKLVTPGSYLIIDDTNLNGHPINRTFGPGPMEAIEMFMREESSFAPDTSREKFGISFSPKGWLRKVR